MASCNIIQTVAQGALYFVMTAPCGRKVSTEWTKHWDRNQGTFHLAPDN